VTSRLVLSARSGGRRVVVLPDAARLGTAAANALLKSLEEPNPGLIWLLLAPSRARLLPTVVSRCLQLPLPPPGSDVALDWLRAQRPGLDRGAATELLRLAGGPVAAVAWLEDESTWTRARQWQQQFVELAAGRGLPAMAAQGLNAVLFPEWLQTLQRWIHHELQQGDAAGHTSVAGCGWVDTGEQATLDPAAARAARLLATYEACAALAARASPGLNAVLQAEALLMQLAGVRAWPSGR